MSQTERLYRLKHRLDAGRCLSREFLLREFEISWATLKRDLAHPRDRMNAPVVYDRDRQGWRLDPGAPVVGTQYELPGLWLSVQKIHALLDLEKPSPSPPGPAKRSTTGTGFNVSAPITRTVGVGF